MSQYKGIIETHNYPNNAPLGQKTTWKVLAPDKYWNFILFFLDHDLQEHCDDGNDRLSIHQNWDETKSLITWCDNGLPSSWTLCLLDDPQWMIALAVDQIFSSKRLMGCKSTMKI